MKRIQQEHPNGCIVASLAMVTGKPYAQLCEEIQPLVGRFKNGEWVKGVNLDEDGLGFESDALTYLSNHGYAIQRFYGTDSHTNHIRPEWPYFPAVNSPLFIGYLVLTVLNGKCHAVFATPAGEILDPFREGTYTLKDYEDVYQVMAVFKVSA